MTGMVLRGCLRSSAGILRGFRILGHVASYASAERRRDAPPVCICRHVSDAFTIMPALNCDFYVPLRLSRQLTDRAAKERTGDIQTG
jgi:hypothetical protein